MQTIKAAHMLTLHIIIIKFAYEKFSNYLIPCVCFIGSVKNVYLYIMTSCGGKVQQASGIPARYVTATIMPLHATTMRQSIHSLKAMISEGVEFVMIARTTQVKINLVSFKIKIRLTFLFLCGL